MRLWNGLVNIVKLPVDIIVKTGENIKGTLTEGENPFENLKHDTCDILDNLKNLWDD